MNNRIDSYLALIEERPELFRQIASYPIMTDRDALVRYTEETGHEVGLVFDNRPYTMVLADVVEGKDGQLFRYMRVVPALQNGGAVVIPVWHSEDGKPLFGLLCIDRHAPRLESVLEFPRGHLEPGMTAEATAVLELCQEMAVDPANISKVRYLGDSYPDTGLISSLVHFYEIELTGPRPVGRVGHEGISSVRWVCEAELHRLFSDGCITCGFSHTAYLKHLVHRG